jgi:hypothetical protein
MFEAWRRAVVGGGRAVRDKKTYGCPQTACHRSPRSFKLRDVVICAPSTDLKY